MNIESWSRSRFIPYARNPRKNDSVVDRMCSSIREFGFKIPILARSDGTVVDGHLRLKAAEKLGLDDDIPVILCDEWTEAQVKAFRLIANRSVAWADWDDDLLRLEMEDLKSLDFDLSLTGFDEKEIERLMRTDLGIPSEVIPEVPTKPISRLGDLWILDRHRVLCGSSMDSEDVRRLLNGEKINVVFTSPPYASQRKYDPTSGFRPVPPDQYVEWFSPVPENIATHLAEDGSYFLNIKEHCEDGQRHLYVKDLTIAHVRLWSWLFVDEFVWRKSGLPGKWNNRFRNQWEPIFHFSRSGRIKIFHHAVSYESDGVFVTSSEAKKNITGFTHPPKYQLDRTGYALPGNVIECGEEHSQTLDHSAAFPVTLPEFFIKAFSSSDDVVFDPFLGSGTVIIAAEKNGRRGTGIEISPGYIDVVVRRWQSFTGKAAILEGDDRTFDEIRDERD
jgi:DNA modification methylase